MKRKERELQTEIAKAQAEENVYILAKSNQVGSYDDFDLSTGAPKKPLPILVQDPHRNPVQERSNLPPAATPAKTVTLNPAAKSWVPEENFQSDRKPRRPSGIPHVPSSVQRISGSRSKYQRSPG